MSTSSRFTAGQPNQDNTLRARTQDIQSPAANQAILAVTTVAEETTVFETINAAQTINAAAPLTSGAPFLNDTLEVQVANSNPAALAAPVQSAPATSTTGGTLAAGTYFYVVTALNANGETIKSNEQSITTTGTTSSNTVNWGAVTGATGFRVYRGTAAGAENAYYVLGNVTSFVDTGAASTAGSPPASNTTGIAVVVTFGNNFQSAGTASVAAAKWGTVKFRFNGTYWVESARALTA